MKACCTFKRLTYICVLLLMMCVSFLNGWLDLRLSDFHFSVSKSGKFHLTTKVILGFGKHLSGLQRTSPIMLSIYSLPTMPLVRRVAATMCNLVSHFKR